eukprot:SAG31_NODE_3469_length_4238_cov_2.647741_5_plen_102_part_00
MFGGNREEVEAAHADARNRRVPLLPKPSPTRVALVELAAPAARWLLPRADEGREDARGFRPGDFARGTSFLSVFGGGAGGDAAAWIWPPFCPPTFSAADGR